MQALNALTLFVNPYFFTNFAVKRKFERKWHVSLGQSKQSTFRDFYYKVAEAKEFSEQEIAFLESFSRAMLLAHKSTATRIADAWGAVMSSLGVRTLRAKKISLYFGLIEDIKRNGKVTKYSSLLAAEIVDAFAWLFRIQAEDFTSAD